MAKHRTTYANAFVKSFFKTLKCEQVYLNEYETAKEAYDNIKWFIEQILQRNANAFGAGI